MIFVQPTNYQEALRIIIQSVHPHEVLYQGEAARSCQILEHSTGDAAGTPQNQGAVVELLLIP